MSRDIKVKIGGAKASIEKFKSIWKAVEKGDVPTQSIEELHFVDADTLLKTLSPKRLDILRQIHHDGPMSVRAVSKCVKRDYKTVYQEVKLLCRIGLIIKDDQGLLVVPYEKISAEISMDLAA